jgi:small subunit ribosomal protein S8
VLTDPVADMLTRIRNANRALHDTTEMPASRLKQEIARLLKDEGYIKDFRVQTPEEWREAHPKEPEKSVPSYSTLVIELKYGRSRDRVISGLKRVSKPGRRIYARREHKHRVMGGMGIAILSTSKGLMTDRRAAQEGVGGEVVAYVW